MSVIKEIIYNKKINVTPDYIFKFVLLFGFICFVTGLIGGYILQTHLIYEGLLNLINNNGILIFNDKYYRFVEVYI